MQLQDLKNDPDVAFWITDSAAMMKNGAIMYTQYYTYGKGGLILRETMEPTHPESPAGLAWRAYEIKSGRAEAFVFSETV